MKTLSSEAGAADSVSFTSYSQYLYELSRDELIPVSIGLQHFRLDPTVPVLFEICKTLTGEFIGVVVARRFLWRPGLGVLEQFHDVRFEARPQRTAVIKVDGLHIWRVDYRLVVRRPRWSGPR